MKKGLSKKYWLYIDSYTHIAVKKERILLYNSYTGKMLEYINELEILGLVKRLLRPSNLQTVLLTDQDLRRPVIRKFVESIRESFIGDLIDASHSRGKPVQMPPILKIRKDVKILKKDSQRTIGEDIIEYLSDIWLYINDRCNQDCWLCSRAYRQFPFCTAIKRGNQELDISLIEIFFRELQHRDHMNIHILGGDTLAYSQMNQLFQTLKIQWTYYLYIHYLNAAGKNDRLRFAAEHGVRLKVPVTFPLNNKKMEETLDTFSATNIKFTLLFPVRNVEEFQMADELIKKFQPLTSEFHPLFDGSNLDFFRENLFIQKEDIEKERPSLKEIHARGVVNAFNFGNLIIRPDGRCYANVNAVPLGELGKDSLYNILFKEMEHGRSWRKIRKYISPCKSCTFEKLCPPISNYNSVIGRYNLCHIYEHEKKIIQKYKIKQEEQ